MIHRARIAGRPGQSENQLEAAVLDEDDEPDDELDAAAGLLSLEVLDVLDALLSLEVEVEAAGELLVLLPRLSVL